MLPDDVFTVILERLPAHEDRDQEAALFAGVTADRLRMAIGIDRAMLLRRVRNAHLVHPSVPTQAGEIPH